MKKILALTIAFMRLIGMGGIGTWAYFQGTETSTGVQLEEDTAGDFQSDGINITIAFTLNQ